MGKLLDEILELKGAILESDYARVIEDADKDYPTQKKAIAKATAWNNGVKPSNHIILSFFLDMVKEYRKKWF